MPRQRDPIRRCMPLQEWPEGDRYLWDEARCPPEGRFSRGRPRIELSEYSWAKIAAGYGRWLTFLMRIGELDSDMAAIERVTPPRLDSFFFHLLELGNSDYTVIARFQEIQGAMNIFVPRGDDRWIICPDGEPLTRALPMRRRELVIYSPADLFSWGLELMETALELDLPARRQVQLRDGLIIALLALRGLRRRSMVSLTLGRSICRDPTTGVWRMELEPGDVKNRRYISTQLPSAITPWLDRYVEFERRELLTGNATEAFWVTNRGEPLAGQSLHQVIVNRSRKRFGPDLGISSHRFRYCIASAAPLTFPETPGIAAAVLRISEQVLGKAYDRSGAIIAARKFHEVLRREMKATEETARAVFNQRRRRVAPEPDLFDGMED